MKIAFVGTGGTGKSTTAKALGERLKLPVVESPSRRCFEKHGLKTEDDQLRASPKQRLALQLDIFQAISEQVKTINEGIFERTPLDNFFYCLLRCHDLLTDGLVDEMNKWVVESFKPFNYTFYFPLYDWPATTINDGMRTTKYAPRLMMAHFLRGFLAVNWIKNYKISDSPVDTRVSDICLLIRGGKL